MQAGSLSFRKSLVYEITRYGAETLFTTIIPLDESIMTNSEAPQKTFSIFRVTTVALPLCIFIVALSIYCQAYWQRSARETGAKALIQLVNLDKPVENSLAPEFEDADGDLVANAPQDDTQLLDPATVIFSYVGGTDNEFKKDVWEDFLTKLSAELGRPVEYRVYNNDRDQLLAVHAGELHVTAVNTGSVPLAVNVCGFVPFCTFGNASGEYGYRMKIITKDTSEVQQIKDLKGRRLTFTSPGSNSGFKAPIVILRNDFGLTFGRDYDHSFSSGHSNSIAGVARGSIETACVASDLLERRLQEGKVELKVEAIAFEDFDTSEDKKSEDQKKAERETLKPIVVEIDEGDFRTIFESERFPPAAFGHVYNLKPEIAEKIKEFFLNYRWEGAISENYGADGSTQFVKVDFKKDWKQVRAIDNATGNQHSLENLKSQ